MSCDIQNCKYIYNNKSTCCNICNQLTNNEYCVLTNCNHKFHKVCLLYQFQYKNKEAFKCPVCDEKFYSEPFHIGVANISGDMGSILEVLSGGIKHYPIGGAP